MSETPSEEIFFPSDPVKFFAIWELTPNNAGDTLLSNYSNQSINQSINQSRYNMLGTHTKDSLLHIRAGMKRIAREEPNNAPISDFLRAHKAGRGSKSVRFNFGITEFHENNKTIEEIASSWMSLEEARAVKTSLVRSVIAHVNGIREMDSTSRGIETHIETLVNDKRPGRQGNYTANIVKQQEYLVNFEPQSNKLALLCQMLSRPSMELAHRRALQDQEEVLRLFTIN